jgi:protein SCO1
MTHGQKIVVTSLWIVVIVAMVGIVTAFATRTKGLPQLFPAPHFSLTDQDGKSVSDKDLHGDVWTAMVFFTSCPTGVCPMMSARMRDLQTAVPNPHVKIVGFSIDPEKDTPEVLKKYAERFDAQKERWFLLTGTKDEMFAAARGLNLVAQPASETQPISHSQKILLVDGEGMVRGIYGSESAEEMQQLQKDAAELAR